MTATHPNTRQKRKQMKRSRSAPDCKHGLGSKIKIGLCAMDKKVTSSSSSSSSGSGSKSSSAGFQCHWVLLQQ
uniref:Uncharacterized protein n=1 Tax=Tetradesmus obliquus TaxID=3088 RepID=A0A383W194_TETOB